VSNEFIFNDCKENVQKKRKMFLGPSTFHSMGRHSGREAFLVLKSYLASRSTYAMWLLVSEIRAITSRVSRRWISFFNVDFC
jgi:hypothetical protein